MAEYEQIWPFTKLELVYALLVIILPLYFTWDEVWSHPSAKKDWPRIIIFVLFALGSMIILPLTIMRFS